LGYSSRVMAHHPTDRCQSHSQIDLDAEFVRPLLSFEILVEQEGEPYTGRQKLTLDDIERLAVPFDVAVLEVGPSWRLSNATEFASACESLPHVSQGSALSGLISLRPL
jgi:hypothetical protein